jgi:hypothetical protein
VRCLAWRCGFCKEFNCASCNCQRPLPKSFSTFLNPNRGLTASDLMNTMNYESTTQPAALRASLRPDGRRSLSERADHSGICRFHRTATRSCLARSSGDSGSAPDSVADAASHRGATAFHRQTLVLICTLLLGGQACLPLAAQEIEAPSVSKPVTAQEQTTGTAPSANGHNHGLKIGIGNRDSNSQTAPATKAASADDDNHGLRIEIGSSDTSLLTPEVRAQLSPEQLYELEMARLQSKKSGILDEDIVIPLSFFGMILAIIGLVSWSRFRRNRMVHETVRLLVEKGQPLPSDLFRERRVTTPASDLRKGIAWAAIGAGLIGYFLVGSGGNWGIGLIPLCIGLGYLIAWKFERNSKPNTGA